MSQWRNRIPVGNWDWLWVLLESRVMGYCVFLGRLFTCIAPGPTCFVHCGGEQSDQEGAEKSMYYLRACGYVGMAGTYHLGRLRVCTYVDMYLTAGCAPI